MVEKFKVGIEIDLGDKTRRLISHLLSHLFPGAKAPRLKFSRIEIPGLIVEGEITMAGFPLLDTQKVPIAVSAQDGAGNPSAVNGKPSYSSSDTSVITVAADPNDATGLTVIATAVGLGTATVTATPDPIADPSVAAGTLDITVTGSAAVKLVLEPGVPVSK